MAVLNEVHAKREAILITKNGKPIARLEPMNVNADEIYGFLEGKGSIKGDIVSPTLSPEEWRELN